MIIVRRDHRDNLLTIQMDLENSTYYFIMLQTRTAALVEMDKMLRARVPAHLEETKNSVSVIDEQTGCVVISFVVVDRSDLQDQDLPEYAPKSWLVRRHVIDEWRDNRLRYPNYELARMGADIFEQNVSVTEILPSDDKPNTNDLITLK